MSDQEDWLTMCERSYLVHVFSYSRGYSTVKILTPETYRFHYQATGWGRKTNTSEISWNHPRVQVYQDITTGILEPDEIDRLIDKEYGVYTRQYIHCCVNSMVEPHTQGSWENVDTAIITPLREQKGRITNLFPEDVRILDYLVLTKDSRIFTDRRNAVRYNVAQELISTYDKDIDQHHQLRELVKSYLTEKQIPFRLFDRRFHPSRPHSSYRFTPADYLSALARQQFTGGSAGRLASREFDMTKLFFAMIRMGLFDPMPVFPISHADVVAAVTSKLVQFEEWPEDKQKGMRELLEQGIEDVQRLFDLNPTPRTIAFYDSSGRMTSFHIWDSLYGEDVISEKHSVCTFNPFHTYIDILQSFFALPCQTKTSYSLSPDPLPNPLTVLLRKNVPLQYKSHIPEDLWQRFEIEDAMDHHISLVGLALYEDEIIRVLERRVFPLNTAAIENMRVLWTILKSDFIIRSRRRHTTETRYLYNHQFATLNLGPLLTCELDDLPRRISEIIGAL